MSNNLATTGAILRNYKRDSIKACCYNLGITPTIVAEIIGLCNAILMGLEEGIDTIIIMGDNLAITNTVLRKWQSTWTIKHMVEDIRLLLKKFKLWEVYYIYREAN